MQRLPAKISGLLLRMNTQGPSRNPNADGISPRVHQSVKGFGLEVQAEG